MELKYVPLSSEELKEVVELYKKGIDEVLKAKAMEYTQNTGDRLWNFHRGALFLDIKPEEYLLALMTKHIEWLYRAIIHGIEPPKEEMFFEHATDIINYIILLHSLLYRAKNREV